VTGEAASRPILQPALDDLGRARLLARATYAAVAVALALAAAKLVAYLMTGSVAMLSALVDSLLDSLASLVNLLAIRHALQPADREHRFGHGKAESIAGLGQAAFIAASALFLAWEGIDRLLHPRPVAEIGVGIAVSAIAAAATVGLVLYQAHVIRRTGSLAISADALHYRGDLLLNGGVVLALVLNGLFGWTFVDPLVALAIVGVLAVGVWGILVQSFDMLMDRELPDEERARLKALVLSDPDIIGLHDLRTRRSGHVLFVQMHLELDGAMPLARAHAIAEAAERRIADAFPGAEVLIHQDPKPHGTTRDLPTRPAVNG
jgi:ferrous-iron efflux pump FieF